MSNKLRYASPVEGLSKINLLCKQKSSRIKNKSDLFLLIINPSMAMNYNAIQIFHARLKVKMLKYIVNLGKQH